jgi:hypothetical protein
MDRYSDRLAAYFQGEDVSSHKCNQPTCVHFQSDNALNVFPDTKIHVNNIYTLCVLMTTFNCIKTCA